MPAIENDTIQQLINLLLLLIPAGGLARYLYCKLCNIFNPDDAPQNNKRARNVLAFVAFAECLMGIVNTIYYYYA